MALNTKNVETQPEGTGGFITKGLNPGNIKCKITSIAAIKPTKTYRPDELNVIIGLAGEDLPNFEGYFISKDQTGPKHKCQVGTVTASEWAFSDFKMNSGDMIYRDVEMIRFLKTLCQELGLGNWVDEMDAKHNFDKVEDLYKHFNDTAPYKDVFMTFCLCGRKYKNGKGYDTYALFLPKPSNLGKPFSKEPGKVQTFNRALHIKESKPKEVNSFGGGNETNNNTGGDDGKGNTAGVAATTEDNPHTKALEQDVKEDQARFAAEKNKTATTEEEPPLPFNID
jgi:hypothetical protein